MATNTADGIVVNYKVETTEGTAATGGGSTGERLRILPSPGLKLTRGTLASGEIRDDANAGKVRLGVKRVEGSYACELSEDTFATFFQALLRTTVVAPVAITFDNGAALTSLTVDSSSQITSIGTTSLVAAGLRVGDVFRLTNMSTAANNSVNCRVKSIDATGKIVTLHGTPLTSQGADNACTLTIAEKLSQATTPTRRTFTIEQYYEDIDLSEYFVGCRVVSCQLNFPPNGIATATFGFIGLDRVALATGSSPYFTSPTEYTTIPLTGIDATITYNGSAIANLTGLSLDLSIAAEGPEVIGSVVMPGTYDNRMTATGTISGLRTDLSNLTLFDAETEFEIHIMAVEPESEPKSFIALYLPAVKILDIDVPLGGNGALIETKRINLQPRVAATGYNAGVLTMSTAA